MSVRALKGKRGKREVGHLDERVLSRRAFLRLTGLVAAGAASAGCRRAVPTAVLDAGGMAPAAGARSGGTLVVGMATTSVVTLDPAAYSDRATETVIRNVFDGLVTRTADNQVIPELAKEYRWADEATVEFDLKQDVRFHNGDELTADDVVFTFERILNQDIGAKRRGFVQEVNGVYRISDHRVRFHLRGPWPVFLQMLVHNQIVPKDYVTRVGDAEFARKPVGCGPFAFVEGDLQDQIVLERYPDYYGGADMLPPVGPAYLDRAIFRFLPDISERVQALTSGSVHIVQSVPSHIVPQLIGHPNVMIKTAVGTRPKLLDLNVTLSPFDDVRVRRALNYAIDANALLTDVAGGYGVVLAGPLSPANLYSDPSLEPYGYDPERAKSLLAEAGYEPEDVAFVIDTYGPYVEIAEAVAGQLRAQGMDVTVQADDYAVLVPQLLDCERQAFLRDWGDSAFDPVGYAEAKWHTRGGGSSAGRGNYACYSNPEVDALIQEGASESDEQVRRDVYFRMQRMVQDDAPAVFLYVPQEIEAASDKVRNWGPSPDSRINLHDVWLADG